MNRLLTTAFAMLICVGLFAIPAQRKPFTVLQSDGTALTVTLMGDESFHFLATLDGVPVVEEADGSYRLAPELGTTIAEVWKAKSAKYNAGRIVKAKARNARRAFGQPHPFIGKKKGLVILVNFANLAMKSTSTWEAWNNQFNQKGYSKNRCIGSVSDYFYDQSYGKFEVEFDVVGPVTVSRDYAYYGQNTKDGDDMHPCTMVIEACVLANNLGVDFTDYDWDGDGEVDMVYVVYAGYGEHAGANADTIWPHEWELTSGMYYGDGTGALTIDGVKIDTYAASCELRGNTGTMMDAIGTACHEFCHCLGLPDFYDISYSGGFGMHSWDILDNGSYNGFMGNGEAPAGFSAYERHFAGWLDYIELSDPCVIRDMPALQDTAVAYIIRNDNYENEYFVLENRQNKGWFKYVGNATTIHGMLAYHVDYDKQIWEENGVNALATHQRMSIIPAGKDYGTYHSSYGYYSVTTAQLATQLFPGTKNVTELTNTSHEYYNGKLFNENTDGTYYMNKPITDIEEKNGLISFVFMGGNADAIMEMKDDDEGEAEYFTLGGVKTKNPIEKGMYIVKKKDRVQKVFVK